jgi:mono/diheme cytochrome c family protein
MTRTQRFTGPMAVALLLGFGVTGCNTRTPDTDEAGPAPVDREVQTGRVDTTDTLTRADTTSDTTATPITPPATARRDTPPAGAAKPSQPSGQAAVGQGLKVSAIEYEGWRQYSVNCARCHGQDVLPNPVAANLLVSLGPNGPVNTPEKFRQITSEGRPDRGMPAFKALLTPAQIDAMHAYVKGRADGRIPAGRPDRPPA